MNPEPEPTTLAEPPVPSYREILRFYYPLAFSWLFMAMEMPIATAVTSHSFQPRIQTAALLMMMGLALFIESPVIDLLSTSTTLAKTRHDFRIIRRFSIWMILLCAAVHAGFCLTPVYDWVTIGILQIPEPVAEATRWPMLVMLPWSPAIGWRRFLQGVLIRSGHTRMIGFGTGVRVVTIGVLCLTLYLSTSLSGVMIAAIALATSVTAEATFIHFASRPIFHERFSYEAQETDSNPLDMKRLLRFHLPLTATTLTFMTTIPLVGAALAQAHDGLVAMAAWQVASGIVFLHRTIVFALPEPIIALYRGPASAQKLARFCIGVGGSSCLFMLLLATFGVDKLVFRDVLGAQVDVTREASVAYVLCALLPLIGAIQAYLRGMLTAHHLTYVRFGAILVHTVVLLLSLWIGLAGRWPGVWVASIATAASASAEVGVLAWAWVRSKNRGLVLAH